MSRTMLTNSGAYPGVLRLFAIVFAGSLVSATGHAQTARRDAEVRSAVAQAEWANTAVLGDDGTTDALPRNPNELIVQRVNILLPGMSVWHVRSPIVHARPYTVGWSGRRVLRLGRFAAPELIEAVDVILRSSVRPWRADSMATLLTRVADPEGGNIVIYPFGALSNGYTQGVAAAWIREKPDDWPRDTTIVRDGATLIRRSVLTQDPNGFGQVAWFPKIYVFTFSASGHLLAWSRRIGPRFIEP